MTTPIIKQSKYQGFFLSQLVNPRDGTIFHLLPGKRNTLGLNSSLFSADGLTSVKLTLKNQQIYVIKRGERHTLEYEHDFYQKLGEYSELLLDKNRNCYYLVMTYYPGGTLMAVLNKLLKYIATANENNTDQHISSLISLLISVISQVIKMHSLDIVHGDLHIGNILCARQANQWSCHIIDPHESAESKDADCQMLFGYIASQIDGGMKHLGINNDILHTVVNVLCANATCQTIIKKLKKTQQALTITVPMMPVNLPMSYALSKAQINQIHSSSEACNIYRALHYKNYFGGIIKILLYATLAAVSLPQQPLIENKAVLCCFYTAVLLDLMKYFNTALQTYTKKQDMPEYFYHIHLPSDYTYYPEHTDEELSIPDSPRSPSLG